MLCSKDYIVYHTLFRRFRIGILVLFIFLLSGLIYYVPSAVQKFSENTAIEHATKTLKQFAILRRYYTDSVIEKLAEDPNYTLILNMSS